MDICASLLFGVHISIHKAALLKYSNSGRRDAFFNIVKTSQFLCGTYSRNSKKTDMQNKNYMYK